MKILKYSDFLNEKQMILDDKGTYFLEFEPKFPLTRDQLESRIPPKNYSFGIGDGEIKINSDLSIDVKGNVEFNNTKYRNIPIKFGRVSGYFNVSNNQLTSLEGAPIECLSFNCSHNQLSTLEFSPKIVHGDYSVGSNIITNFNGAPEYIGGKIWCYNIGDKFSLIGLPYKVNLENIRGSINNFRKVEWIDYLWDNNEININHVNWVQDVIKNGRNNKFEIPQKFIDKYSYIFEIYSYM